MFICGITIVFILIFWKLLSVGPVQKKLSCLRLIHCSWICRYQSLRRTIRSGGKRSAEPSDTSPIHHATATVTNTTTSVVSTVAVSTPSSASRVAPTTSEQPSSTNQRRPSQERRERSHADAPGCLFIRRRDFHQFVGNHTVRSSIAFVFSPRRNC